MKSLVFIVVSLTLALGGPAAAQTPADIAGKVETFYKSRSDIRATFTQKVRKPGRRRTLTKTGNVFFKRPGMMRWDYKRPEKVHYISDGSILWTYQPEDNLVTRLDVKESQLYHQAKFLFGQGDIAGSFKLSKGKAAGDGFFALVLEPKRSSRNFKRLTLFVDAKTGEIKRTELVDPYDSVSTITFDRIQYKELKRSAFAFTPPSNATIKDLSKGGKTAKQGSTSP